MKQAFSTGEVAKLLHVSPGTVSRWFDSGKLKGYFIGGSRNRRIPRASLISFCRENGLPLGELENEQEAEEKSESVKES
jgi:two-component system response regulator RpaA